MPRQLDRNTLTTILEAEHVEAISADNLADLFRAERDMPSFVPDGVYRVDPRNGDRILYNSSRSRRPHDHVQRRADPAPALDCAICQGRTTGVVDVVELSDGFSFINKNLFPAVFPLEGRCLDVSGNGLRQFGGEAYGFHFLQWTSSFHDRDWHNMPLADLSKVMGRLAALEKSLIGASATLLPQIQPEAAGFVSIIKNHGRLVGGSLEHGHQQIVFSNVMPRRVWENQRFAGERDQPFPAYLWRQNPKELLIVDYGQAALMVPFFMRRPYDMILTVKDPEKGYLHELTDEELGQVANGWHDAIRAIHELMPELGREVAYNVVTHSGSGTGIYFEFLPYTQEDAGLEKLGLFVCQERPGTAAARVRQFLGAT